MREYTLYMHVCPNKKRYVGITKVDPIKRWNGGSGYASNREFYADIKKFGWRNIKHKIIRGRLTKEEAEEWKTILIEKYNTTDPQRGYNFFKGKERSSDRFNANVSKYARPANVVPCICKETGKKYESLVDAARDYGTSRGSVSLSCKTDGEASAGGKHFIYASTERRKTTVRNSILKDSESWDWSINW